MINLSDTAPYKKLLLVGNPNCGKTTLFNELTGSNQRVGNWSGVTVEQKRGVIQTSHGSMVLVDLPGTYSLLQLAPDAAIDERITADCISEGIYDCIVNVVDAANLERNLYLTCQLIERGVPVVVVLNRIDLVENHRQIDCEQLSQRLGCPVVAVSASNKKGFDQLIKTLETPVNAPQCHIQYPDSITQALEARPDKLPSHRMLSYLEGEPLSPFDPVSGKVLELQQIITDKEGFEPDIVLAQARYAWIESVLVDVTHSQALKIRISLTKKIPQVLDQVILHRFWGIPIFLCVMYALFFFAINIGGAFQDFFDISSNLIFVDGIQAIGNGLGLPGAVTAVLASGIGKGFNTVITFVPVIGAMFLALSFLEDSGYMARAAFVMDRLMRTLGLPGKSFVPLIVGFGCNVPAIMGSRTLEQKRDRILTVMISPFMSCGARLAIFTLFVAAFFPTSGSNIVFLLYFIGVIMAVLTGLMLKKTLLRGEPEPLVLELPPYQWPRGRNLWLHAWHRLRRFLINASKLIVPVCLIVGTLNSVTTDFKPKGQSDNPTILAQFGQTMTPIFYPMGIHDDNWPATVGLFTGVMAKEVVIGTLNSLYTQEIGAQEPVFSGAYFREGFSQALWSIPQNLMGLVQDASNPILASSPKDEVHDRIYGEMLSRFDGKVGAFSYLLFVLLYFPCISATAAMVKEVNKNWTLFSVGWTTLVAYASAVLFYQLATFELHPLQSTSWLAGIIGLFGVLILILRQYKPSKPVPTPIMLSSG